MRSKNNLSLKKVFDPKKIGYNKALVNIFLILEHFVPEKKVLAAEKYLKKNLCKTILCPKVLCPKVSGKDKLGVLKKLMLKNATCQMRQSVAIYPTTVFQYDSI